MKTIVLSLFLFVTTSFIFAQQIQTLNGKVTADLDDLSKISILNKNQKYEKVTVPGGYFSIKVELNDTLIFKSDFLYDYEHVVTKSDFETDLLQIRMKKISNLLQEVQIYTSINAVDFGILSKPAKQFTPTERRQKAANSGPVDLIANAFNGKRAMFKKLIKLEGQNALEDKFINMYGSYNIQKDFEIPDEFIDSFSQFACQYKNIVEAVTNKEKQKLSFLLIDVSLAFKKQYQIN